MPSRASAISALPLLWAALSAQLSCADDSSPAEPSFQQDAASRAQLDAAPARFIDAQASATPGFADASPGTALEQPRSEAGVVDAALSAARVRVSLVLPDRWTRVGSDDDPFEDRPFIVNCAAGATMTEILSEERVYSVDTGSCEYLTAMQSTRRDVLPDELVKIRLWHFELNASEAAEAHAALTIDGLPVLDERVQIPQPGGLLSRQWRAPRAIPAGAKVFFHLHNHGANSWSLVEVSAGP